VVSFPEALRFWLKLGFISFGGPAGQIAIMHQALVRYKVGLIPVIAATGAAGMLFKLTF
jgi:chromate transport protein ChrA